MTNYFQTYHNQSNWPPIKKPENRVIEKLENTFLRTIQLDYIQLDNHLMDALNSRKSSKEMRVSKTLDALKLGTLLKWSIGMFEDRRMFPSAGELYTIKCLVAIKDLGGVKSGLYEYIPEHHRIAWLGEYQELKKAFVQEDIDFNVCLVLGSDLDRACQHYGERGYRFSLLEAGHMMQNIMLVASTLELAVAPIGGFKDDVANELSTHENFKSMYLVPIGEYID
ncbi:SagB family peptide dehydrogenase [Alkalicoccobacillus porphyridii]|nr:SagB family peptide dehydrogenase [Alkalicoccobacillus porphyridii]